MRFSAALIFLVAVTSVAGVALTIASESSPAPRAMTGPTRPSAGVTAATTESACGRMLPYTRSNDLVVSPSTVWSAQGPATIASSVTAGAFHDDAGYWSCYSRTPEGALYAAYNAAQYCAVPNLAARALPLTLADGPGKATATAAARSNKAPCSPLSPSGFVVQAYDGTNATVYLLVTTATGAPAAAGNHLVWQHGDWKVKVDASGHNPIAAIPAMAAADYTPWGANG